MSRLLGEAIASLPPREQTLIDAHYRQGLSMRAIAREMELSESRISQLHARCIRHLRLHLDSALSLEPRPQDTRTSLRLLKPAARRGARGTTMARPAA
jgi:DNA-directed RNA polymerase specialized sigma24 family protein